MKRKRVLIIHFRSPMDYPPVYNLARYLASKDVEVELIAGKRKESSTKLREFGVQLTEVDIEKGSSLRNYLAYFIFYIKAFSKLVRNVETPVIYIESISSPPVFLYYLLHPFSKRTLAIHYHEYFDKEEHKRQSFLERFGRTLEPLLFRKSKWISHTNKDRLDRFHSEFPAIDDNKLQCMPNYPPMEWTERINQTFQKNKAIVKLVYVGSVSLGALYLRELVEWLQEKGGRVTCDVYTKYMNGPVLELIKNNDKVICYKGSLNYDDLPIVLPQYDVGLILYNGISSTNFVYNAPNKLFEYMACGIDVWFSTDLKSSYAYETSGTYPKVVKVDFSNLQEFDYQRAIDKNGLYYQRSSYVMESVYQVFYNMVSKEV